MPSSAARRKKGLMTRGLHSSTRCLCQVQSSQLQVMVFQLSLDIFLQRCSIEAFNDSHWPISAEPSGIALAALPRAGPAFIAGLGRAAGQRGPARQKESVHVWRICVLRQQEGCCPWRDPRDIWGRLNARWIGLNPLTFVYLDGNRRS